MKQNIYTIYDKVGEEVIVCGNGRNDTDFIRKNLPWIMKTFPLRDVEVRFTGLKIDMDNGQICIDDIEESRIIPWSAYEFPKDRIENMTSVGIEVPSDLANSDGGEEEKAE